MSASTTGAGTMRAPAGFGVWLLLLALSVAGCGSMPSVEESTADAAAADASALDTAVEWDVQDAAISDASSETSTESGTPNTAVFTRRFITYFANVGDPADLAGLLDLITRSAAAGYNGIFLADRGGQYIDLYSHPASATYVQNFATATSKAKSLGIALIPYSFDEDQASYPTPTLQESVPCKGEPFLVSGAAASDPTPALAVNGGFEQSANGVPTGWHLDTNVSLDTTVQHSGTASLRLTDPKGHNGQARISRTLGPLSPFHEYEVTLWVKGGSLVAPSNKEVAVALFGLDGEAQQQVLYSNRAHGLGSGDVAPNQPWTEYTLRWNTLRNTMVLFYFGVWSTEETGDVWIDDLRIQEVGLKDVNTALPIAVTSADGSHAYAPSTDYVVGDGALMIPAGSTIASGSTVLVSYYQVAHMTNDIASASTCRDETFAIQASISHQLDQLFGSPPGFMMTYDEWRVANWDPTCGNMTGGQYMANAFQRSAQVLKSINSAYELYMWSDMADPNENAKPVYYIVNGSLDGSWNGLPHDVVIVNWTGADKSLEFFSQHGFRQILSTQFETGSNGLTGRLADLRAARAAGATNIVGFNYVSWETRDYGNDIQVAADALRQARLWGTGPLP